MEHKNKHMQIMLQQAKLNALLCAKEVEKYVQIHPS